MARGADPPTFTILSEGDDLVLAVHGAVGVDTAADICRRLHVMCDLAGDGRVILDLRHAGDIDTRAFRRLGRTAARCDELGVELVVRMPRLPPRPDVPALRVS